MSAQPDQFQETNSLIKSEKLQENIVMKYDKDSDTSINVVVTNEEDLDSSFTNHDYGNFNDVR